MTGERSAGEEARGKQAAADEDLADLHDDAVFKALLEK
jgi:hypothetical protein